MSEPSLYAVIMAGGSGTRFWPASRRARPKQFLPISGEGSRPMIAETYERLAGQVPPERILVVTAEEQRELVAEALPDLASENVLLEPMARNTAPCIALAAFEIARRDPNSVQIVLPADHIIQPKRTFQESLTRAAAEAVASEALLTFGIRPNQPATGYGYIEVGELLSDVDGFAVHSVERFVEKPDLETAKEFLSSGKFLWNSGMFVWATGAILAAYEEHLPEVPAGLREVEAGKPLDAVYAELTPVPIDKAIMERARNVRVLPVDYRWSDVGSWAALPEIYDSDSQGNYDVLSGGARLFAEASSGNVVYCEGEEILALVGVRDLVVVRSGKTTLVCRRESAQDVKKIVERLKNENSPYL